MPRLSGIKDAIGRTLGRASNSQENTPARAEQTETITVNPTVLSDTTGIMSTLTPAQITARNHAILAKVSHNPPAHESFMEFIKNIWRVVGPIAFIVFTAGEVYYY